MLVPNEAGKYQSLPSCVLQGASLDSREEEPARNKQESSGMCTIAPPLPGKGLLLVLCPSWLQNIGKKVLVWSEGPFVPRFHLLNQLLEHMLPLSYVFFRHGCSAVSGWAGSSGPGRPVARGELSTQTARLHVASPFEDLNWVCSSDPSVLGTKVS